MTSNTKTLPTLPPIPDYALTPLDWAGEASRRATEYLGMPESLVFINEARRYMSLHKKITELEAENKALRESA